MSAASAAGTVDSDGAAPARRWPGRHGLALGALGLGAFIIGTSELVVVGILGPVARDAGVSVSTAGTLVTAYALGIAVGGPIATALTTRFDRRLMLRLALAGYVAGNLLTALAPGFGVLAVSRAATGTVHGLFIGVATVVAAGLAEPGRAGRAISVVFGGLAVSTVVGVPLGTLIGQAAGWRATFVTIVILGIVVLALTLALVPRVEAAGSGRLGDEARSALAVPVLVTLCAGFLIIGGQFTALTYLAPFLGRVTGISGGGVSTFLLVFGIATAAGVLTSGKVTDRSPALTLIVASAGQAASLAALYLAGPSTVLTLIALACWGVFGFGLVSTALQVRVISLAGRGGDLAASLGASAANAGIAAGALIGGQVIAGLGVREVPLAASLILLGSVPATVAARFLRPRAASDGAPAIAPPPAAGRSFPASAQPGPGRRARPASPPSPREESR